MNLSLIIVNYNLAKEIENCINSILNTTIVIDYEIIIIDNNSPDKDLPEVEKKYKSSNIHFYYLDNNLGFGKGCNFGFLKASGEYICFLNPDTIIKEDVFSPIISLFKNDGLVGIAAPKQQVKPPLFDFSAGFYPNILFELFNLFGMGVFLEGFIVTLYTKLKGNNILEIDWILGAAIFIKSEIFKQAGGFDKDYFMFFEEVDLCKRVKNSGYKIIYCPGLKIHHIGSVSGKKDYTLYTIRTYSSKNIFISKHYQGVYKLLMKLFLRMQAVSQIIIWTVLFPLNRKKSSQKLNAFFYLLRNNMKLVSNK
ncbi:MAG: glycosyltransferase family 2 protein [Ignavibacteriaceae bacterium]